MNKKYETLDEGKIISVNNFIFEDGSLDHAWNKGRLCLILYSNEEFEYILPIKSTLNNNYKDKYYINNDSMLYFYDNIYSEPTLREYNGRSINKKIMLNAKGRQNIEGYINLNNIYKIPVTFRNEVAKISYDVYQNVIKKLYYFHKVKNEEEIKKLAL